MNGGYKIRVDASVGLEERAVSVHDVLSKKDLYCTFDYVAIYTCDKLIKCFGLLSMH